MDKEKFKLLPYDFIKENQIIASQSADGFEVISPNKISSAIYHELYKYLKKDFNLKIDLTASFSKPSLTFLVIKQCFIKIFFAKVGPIDICKV